MIAARVLQTLRLLQRRWCTVRELAEAGAVAVGLAPRPFSRRRERGQQTPRPPCSDC